MLLWIAEFETCLWNHNDASFRLADYLFEVAETTSGDPYPLISDQSHCSNKSVPP